jgi:hypothetical protein
MKKENSEYFLSLQNDWEASEMVSQHEGCQLVLHVTLKWTVAAYLALEVPLQGLKKVFDLY